MVLAGTQSSKRWRARGRFSVRSWRLVWDRARRWMGGAGTEVQVHATVWSRVVEGGEEVGVD
jgi:hypothetical protein